MNLEAAQIEMVLLDCVERQAERTAAALERVRDLMLEVAEVGRRELRTSDFGLKEIPKPEAGGRKTTQRRSRHEKPGK